jgi:hypothetical protein
MTDKMDTTLIKAQLQSYFGHRRHQCEIEREVDRTAETVRKKGAETVKIRCEVE